MKKIDQLQRLIQRLDKNAQIGETLESEQGFSIYAIWKCTFCHVQVA